MNDKKIQAWTNPTEHANNYLIGSLVSHRLHSIYVNNDERSQEEFKEFWRLNNK